MVFIKLKKKKKKKSINQQSIKLQIGQQLNK